MTTRSKRSAKSSGVEALLGQDGEMLRRLMQEALQQVLEAEVTEEKLCGHTFSASTISRINASLDGVLSRFADRWLDEAHPYLVLDSRYEKVCLDGVIRSQSVLVAIGINWDGRRCVLGVELSNRESRSSWTNFVTGLKARGLHGVEFVVSDDHAGLKRAVAELLPDAVWQRC